MNVTDLRCTSRQMMATAQMFRKNAACPMTVYYKHGPLASPLTLHTGSDRLKTR